MSITIKFRSCRLVSYDIAFRNQVILNSGLYNIVSGYDHACVLLAVVKCKNTFVEDKIVDFVCAHSKILLLN